MNSSEIIRQDICQILRKCKPPKNNLSYQEFQSLKKLKNNEEIVILAADKGNATVVMNTIDYKNKMSKLLEDSV